MFSPCTDQFSFATQVHINMLHFSFEFLIQILKCVILKLILIFCKIVILHSIILFSAIQLFLKHIGGNIIDLLSIRLQECFVKSQNASLIIFFHTQRIIEVETSIDNSIPPSPK